MADTERTYTINEAATLTGLPRNTLRQRIRLGQLDATIHEGRFGEEYRIPHAALSQAGLLPEQEQEWIPAEPEPSGAATRDGNPLQALTELYERHEHAMFRLGYLQAELERTRALAETAESLRRENDSREQELRTLRGSLEERDRAVREAETAERELEEANRRLRELEAAHERLEQQAREREERLQELEAARRRPWWRFGRD